MEVHNLYAKGYVIDAIMRLTGHTVVTIKNYLKDDNPLSNGHYDSRMPDKLAPYEQEVINMRSKGITYKKIHEHICEKGYTGTVASLRMFMQKERTHKRSLVTNVAEPKERISNIEDEYGRFMFNEIYYANLCPVIGSEQGGIRPVIILQNDIGNRFSPTTIVAVITSRAEKTELPTHVNIRVEGLNSKSIILLEQIRTIDKSRIREFVDILDISTMSRVDKETVISLGISDLI